MQDLLIHLEQVGFEGSPRFLGIDERGREILTFIDGEVPAWSPLELPDLRLRSAARLVRGFHDATAGSALAGGEEVVCHRDLGAHNTVFVKETAVGLIDWDQLVGPGPRLYDVADACWSFADVAGEALVLAEQARRLALFCDAYGWSDRHAIVDQIAHRIRRAIDDHAQHGRCGAVAVFRRYEDWMRSNASSLKSAL